MIDEKRIIRALSVFPPSERAHVREVVQAALSMPRLSQGQVADLAADLIVTSSRAVGKRLSDRKTDRERRTLIGARVPRNLADHCKAEAERRGMSTYRWVVWALESALERPWT